MNDSSEETRLKPLFQRKKKRKRGHLEHSQWNLSAHLRKVSPKSLGNLCAPLQLHSQAVLGVTARRDKSGDRRPAEWRQTWAAALEVSRSLSAQCLFCLQVLLGSSYLRVRKS